MSNSEKFFIELIQVAVGNSQLLSRTPSVDEWEDIYDIAKKQTLIGICFYAIKLLPENCLPPQALMDQWMIKGVKLEERNKRMNRNCRFVHYGFTEAGFDCIILKGQGNLAYYPEHLRIFRQPGDVDVWVKPKEKANRPIRKVIEYCLSTAKCKDIIYHHMDFPVIEDTEVEVHFRPTFLFSPFRNRRLQRWMNAHFEGVRYNKFDIPSVEFNVVFQLLHIYNHLFMEGIGFRQLMDYYFVLDTFSFACDEKQKDDVFHILCKLGVMSFASALMYVIKEVMGDCRVICEPNEKSGKKLLAEIMLAGNFGQFDERYNFAEASGGKMQNRGAGYAWMKLKRNFRFLFSYPNEVLWEPLFRCYHAIYRLLKLWRYE